MSYRYGTPIPIPITPNKARVEHITSLNGRITQWGYTNDIKEYVEAFKAEYAAAQLDDELRETWIYEKGKWMQEADDILESVITFLSEGWLDTLSPEVTSLLWRRISAAVWKIQYMTVFLQVYLDHVV